MAEDHWFVGMLKKEWPQIRKLMFNLACFALGAVAIALLYDKFIIPGKDAELSQKNETIRTISEERDRANRENEKLAKQIESLRIYRGQDAPPLKRKALILAEQIREFAKDWKDTDSPDVQNETVFKYIHRFGLRAQIIRDDLDQNGQHSETFDGVMFNFGYNYKDVRTIADEIERLAKNLPD